MENKKQFLVEEKEYFALKQLIEGQMESFELKD